MALNRVKRLAPEVETVLLVDRAYTFPVTRKLVGDTWIAGPDIDLIRDNPRFVRKLRRAGRRIHVWTVNTSEDLDLCVELGVEAVITDKPGAALGHLGRGV